MREIKFRAWDIAFGIMLNDIVVYDGKNIVGVDWVLSQAYGDKWDERCEAGCEEAGPEHYCLTGEFAIMQFTGLKDKNGAEIYEGDILTIADDGFGSPIPHDFKGVVRELECCMMVDSDRMAFKVWQEITEWEIIGNIHQTPSFL